jgi:hypothetical protein
LHSAEVHASWALYPDSVSSDPSDDEDEEWEVVAAGTDGYGDEHAAAAGMRAPVQICETHRDA